MERPFLITVTLRAFTRASKLTTSPSFHRSTVMVSPGNTGEEKRAAWLLIRAGSKPAKVDRTARQVIP